MIAVEMFFACMIFHNDGTAKASSFAVEWILHTERITDLFIKCPLQTIKGAFKYIPHSSLSNPLSVIYREWLCLRCELGINDILHAEAFSH